jgi:hypothetical protein
MAVTAEPAAAGEHGLPAHDPGFPLADRARRRVEQSDFAGAERLIRRRLNGVRLDASHAEALYVLAVADLNPALLACWQALANLYELTGREGQARNSLEQVQFLASLPEELLGVASMIHDNKLLKAERLCRHFLQDNQHHIEGAATAGTDSGQT